MTNKMIPLYFLLLWFTACKKKDVIEEISSTTVEVPTPPVVVVPQPSIVTVEVGTGTGPLVLKNQVGKNFIVKPGTYSYFQFDNLKDCTVNGANAVKIVGGNVSLTTMNGVTISGISIENSAYRAFNFYNEANDLTLKDMTLSNIGDVCMVFSINKKYDGTPASFSNNIQLINIKADNISTFFASQGTHTNDGFSGLIKNFKMSGCSITNSPNLSDGVFLGLAEDYEFSNNTINNVNSTNGNHNGIFHLIGNGKIFDNKCTNHQGNMVRAWVCSITKDAGVEIYNNVVWNSTRYGAFEVQVPPYLKAITTFKPGTSKIYNNTVGKLNTGLPKYFEGRLLDVYDTYSTIEVYNNLVFNNVDGLILNQMSSKATVITRNSDNVYKATAQDAVEDLTAFKSLIPGIGKL
ncbi:hypothetical protein DHW03_05160 [Pedobacter yonginense]|uniref:Right handed beta helix domain-containing protein n=1 Tax=Pedobacter yonginense TaxID=651869 RepID=A0A317ETI8_9SPHI|nr:hypothetical protein [Pedobacter yonginense]PWS29213.1 hypothetical protein DHW03_05160 [Pedobacter yonginense]